MTSISTQIAGVYPGTWASTGSAAGRTRWCRSADATGSLFLIQLAAEDCRNLKKWDLAQFAAEQMLGFDANYAGGHYEMGMVKLQTGQVDAAHTELGKAIELWKNADSDLDE